MVRVVTATENDEVSRAEGVVAADGRARFISPHAVQVDAQAVKGQVRRRHCPRSGALRPRRHSTRDPLHQDGFFPLDVYAASLAVIVAGPLVRELAQAFVPHGAVVVLADGASRLHPGTGADLEPRLAESLLAEAIHVLVCASPRLAQASMSGVRLRPDSGEPVEADALQVATGRYAAASGSRPQGGRVETS